MTYILGGTVPLSFLVTDSSGDAASPATATLTVTLPNGTKPTIDRNFVIANITAPSGLVAEE